MPVILQVPPVFRRFVYPWITPAHAGKTSTPALTGFPLRDHPRACGENTSMAMTQASTTGSPPRMRGKRAQPSPAPFWSRITPRACGENIPRPLHNLRVQGSPPRMRGKRQRVNLRKHRLGITPAHAGKTTEGSWISTAKRDHPRACGENIPRPLHNLRVQGSPPRMRGKQRRVVLQYEDRGITPAHAGKTFWLPRAA